MPACTAAGDALHGGEERADVVGRQVGERHDVRAGAPRARDRGTPDGGRGRQRRRASSSTIAAASVAVDDGAERRSPPRGASITAWSTPRIAPLPTDAWDDDTRAQLGAAAHRARTARPLNIFATLANHPKLLKRWLVFANHVLFKSTLSFRDRELLILRTGWNCRSDYEWGQHVIIAQDGGFTDDDIAPRRRSVRTPPAGTRSRPRCCGPPTSCTATPWCPTRRGRRWPSATDASSSSTRSSPSGSTTSCAFALNSCGVPLDAGVEGLPAEPWRLTLG